VVVGGVSTSDQAWLVAARQQLDPNREGLEIRYFTDRSFAQILDHIRALPPQTVVLVGAFQRDATGQNFATRDAISRIAAASPVPVYVLQDRSVGIGSVGGRVVSFESHGRMAAELALRVLRGERPGPIDTGTIVPMVDARQLARWGLDERRLPTGSVVLFQEPPLWKRYRWWILGA